MGELDDEMIARFPKELKCGPYVLHELARHLAHGSVRSWAPLRVCPKFKLALMSRPGPPPRGSHRLSKLVLALGPGPAMRHHLQLPLHHGS